MLAGRVPFETPLKTRFPYLIAPVAALALLGCSSGAETTGTAEQHVVPTGSLQGYWKFDETSGTSAADSSGNNRTGTYSGTPTRVAGRVNNGLAFDGSDFVNIGNITSINGVAQLTLAAWIKRASVNGAVRIGKQQGGQDVTIGAESDGKLYFQLSTSGDAGGTIYLNDTAWHHLALVFDGTLSGNSNRLKGYVDGVQQTLAFKGTIPTKTTTNTQAFRIGRVSNAYSEGTIDEVFLYSRALSAVEVTQLFQNTGSSDVTPPSTPQNLAPSNVAQTSLTLSWGASTDNVGVTGYRVFRNGTQVGTPTGTSFNDTGLTASTTYQYTVAAVDAAGNVSAPSAALPVTTLAIQPDTTPPLVPQNLAASSVTQTSLSLTWTASTDNVGVTGYRVFRDGAQIGTPAGPGFPDSGLAPSTTYQYRVSALDAAGNVSAQSSAFSVTTLALPSDTTPPSCTLTSPAPSTISGTVTMTATASDNVGVTSVGFEVDGVEVGIDTTAPYSYTLDTTTIGNGTHALGAHAHDAAGNEGHATPVDVIVSNGTSSFQNEIMVTGLTLPTNMEFLPNGAMIIGQLGGRIRYVPPGSTQPSATDFMQITNIGTSFQGLMDMILDPNFATNGYFYVSYTRGSPNRDRVSRFTASGATASLASEVVIWEDATASSDEHHGLALAFDGASPRHLFITVGEHFLGDPAQNLSSELGKVLRINIDGTIPTDNPFYDGSGPNADRVYALGLRSPFRSFFDVPTNRLFVGDVGGNSVASSQEEFNVITPGANYGWPICEGNCGAPTYALPFYTYPHAGRDACAVSGVVYRGTAFPAEYQGNYFIGDFAQNWIKRIVFNGNGTLNSVQNFMPVSGMPDTASVGSVVHMTVGPDGALWYTSIGNIDGENQNPFIGRIRYAQGNMPPVAQASATPLIGQAPLTVSFSSTGSSDPEGQALSYLWTFGDGQTSTLANPTHVYSTGTFTARLSVSDGVLSTLASPLIITSGNPPVPSILGPLNNALFRAGDIINYSGSATDTEDGLIPPSGLSWNIDFHHATHVHPSSAIVGQASGTFLIPTSGHDFNGQTSYEFRLTATDSTNVFASQSVTIHPDKSNIVLDTVPSGLTVTLDGITKTTPLTYDTLIGFTHTLGAASQIVGPTTYTFARWSDGGAQTHNITVPAASTSYVATFAAASTPLPSGLVAAYSMNAGSGTSVADTSGNAHTGTLSGAGATWTTSGKYGGGLNFNGSSGAVTVPDSPAFALGNFTLSAWIKPTALTGWQTILIKEQTSGCGYWLQTADRLLSTGFNGGTGCLEHADGNLVVGVWTHVASVFNDTANTVSGYVNGVLVFTEPETRAPQSNTQPIVMGQTANGERWRGTLDEVHIYNRALSVAEIVQDMNTPSQ